MKRQRIPHVDDPAAVGVRLREARERAGLSQRALSFPGCTPAYISRLESGDRTPSLQLLRELGRRLGVSADWLATGTEPVDGGAIVDAELALRLGDVEAAEHRFERAAAEAGGRVVRARALAGLGEIALGRGEVAVAITRLEEARDLLGAALIDFPSAVETLGRAYAIAGDLAASIALFESAAAAARERQDDVNATRYETLLANALIDSGEAGRATGLLARILSATPTDPLALARLYWSQSRLHAVTGRPDLAAEYAQRALAAVELTEHHEYAARAQHLLAYVELERGNPEEALDLLQAAAPEIARMGDAFLLALFGVEEARALVALGRLDEAREAALAAAGQLTTVSKIDGLRAFSVLGDVLAATGEVERAIEILTSCAADLAAVGSPLASDLYARASRLLEGEGRTEEALDLLKQAVSAQSGTRHTVG